MEQNIKVGRLMAVALPVLTLLTNMGLVGVLWWGGADVIGGRLSVGQLVAFNSYLMIGMTPLLLLGNVLTMVSRAEASAERVLEVLATEPVVRPAAAPQPHPTGGLAFKDVSFRYNERGGYVLDDINLGIEPGQHVALLGATGSGKSTLVNLVPRFYDVTNGSISIGGVDLRDLELERLRSRIGTVLQETTLFSGTVSENIAYGRPDAPLEEVIAAATAAQAHDFITAMPGGYDATVEAGGANLSGGQRQRIAIARALLIDPDILILDDSTSAVDLETEARIGDALDELMDGRTSLVVAQRISSALAADQIIVLDRGRVISAGTHDELLEGCRIYREIYHSQLGDDTPVDRPAPGGDA
jgi:ATP-binding cassette subfamily B protein